MGPARIDESNRYQYLIYLDKTVIIKNKKNIGIPLGRNPVNLQNLIPAWWPVLLEAFLTVDWTTLGWFEWNLGFLSTVAAGNLGHLSWTTVVTAPLSITHNFHSYYVT